MMRRFRTLSALGLVAALLGVAACSTAPYTPPPPPTVRPAVFTALGLSAAYLNADVIVGRKARAAKLRAAKIKALGPAAAADYLSRAELEFRQQTAGIGIDVIRLGDSVLIRIPAVLTFNSNSAEIKPQFDATLNEVARTLKAYNQTYVDVLAHTDTTGAPAYNQALSQKRATAVAAFLSNRGVARARVASKGLGETAPLYNPDLSEDQRAANRRVEIRMVPFRQTDLR